MDPFPDLRPPELWLRAFRCLMRLYPSRFRQRFEGQILRLTEDCYRRRLLLGPSQARSWLLLSLGDLLLGVFAERAAQLGRRVRPQPLSSSGPTMGSASPSQKPIHSKGTGPMANLMQDVRYAARSLAKQPAFTLVAVVTVALGIGANAAMFSVVNGVLLSRLPYHDPDRLVRVYQNDRINGTVRENASIPDYLDYIEMQTVFEGMGGWSYRSLTLQHRGEEPERIVAARTTASLFPVLGREALAGRTFTPEEDRPGGPAVCLLSYGLWQRRFGGEDSTIGKVVQLDGIDFEVVGVMPPGFQFPSPMVDVWTPIRMGPGSASRGQHGLGVVARLKPESTLEIAGQEMSSIMANLEERYPRDNVGRGAHVESLNDVVTGSIQPALRLLMAAVGLVLLIACANLANLQLGRATTRGREMAVRAALGAARMRIVRQLLTESLLLSVPGGILGILLAFLAIRLLVALDPAAVPRLEQVSLDLTVLAFAAAATLATGLIFGTIPALQASRPRLQTALNQGGRADSATGGSTRIRWTLAVGQVALAFMLTAGTGLLLRSMWEITRIDPGFRPEGLASASLNLPPNRYPVNFREARGPKVKAFYKDALSRLESDPRVDSAALALAGPTESSFTSRIGIEGGPTTPEEGIEEEYIRAVTPGYFSLIGTPLIKGRDFSFRDTVETPLVVVVNRAFVRKYFEDEDPLGQRINFWGRWRDVVGVAGDVSFMGLDRPARPAVYTSLEQVPFQGFTLLVRGRGESDGLFAALRSTTRELDPTLALFNVGSVEEQISRSTSQRRFILILLSLFAGLALVLATVGIYGVVSYSVSRRRHEFGVRLSLGAGRSDLQRMVMSQGLRMAGLGMLLGLVGALAGSSLVTGLLFEVRAADPLNLAAAGLFLGGIALAACLAPARRAGRVDPLVALRSD